jgi:hypothetical protein
MRLAPLLLLLLAAALQAESIATWAAGDGSRGGAPAAIGDGVAAGEPVVAGSRGASLSLAGFARGAVLLEAGSRARLSAAPGDGGDDLLIELDGGAVQIDVEGTGPYRVVRARGAAVEVAVTGTLFVVRRDLRGVDTVALVRGQVQVRLRREIAASLGRDVAVTLDAGRGVEGSASGLGQPGPIAGSPLLAAAGSAGDGGADLAAMGEVVAEAVADALLADGLELAGEVGGEVLMSGGDGGLLGSSPPPPPF